MSCIKSAKHTLMHDWIGLGRLQLYDFRLWPDRHWKNVSDRLNGMSDIGNPTTLLGTLWKGP
jgi:hypothetical protein